MEPTATYQGRMIVLNCTGSEITNLRVEHRCGQASPSVVRADKLAYGRASIPAQITAVKGSNDLWDVEFKIGKTQIRRNGKQCNMPNSKEMSCAVINLYKKSYSIVTPDKSPCLLNHY